MIRFVRMQSEEVARCGLCDKTIPRCGVDGQWVLWYQHQGGETTIPLHADCARKLRVAGEREVKLGMFVNQEEQTLRIQTPQDGISVTLTADQVWLLLAFLKDRIGSFDARGEFP